MVRIIVLFVIVLAAGANSQAQAQKLHFISVAQTNISLMHDEFEANERFFYQHIEILGKSLGMKVVPQQIVGDQYTCNNISIAVSKTVDEVKEDLKNDPGSKSIIVFYFSGHGNAPDPSRSSSNFPQIECSQFSNDIKQPLLENIYMTLGSSLARFVFVGADTCNNSIGTPSEPPEKKLTELRIQDAAKKKSDQILFGDFTGGVIATSSKRGERSFYFERSHGRFTGRLIDLLVKGVVSPKHEMAWREMAEGLEKPISVTRHDQQVGENPFQWEQHPLVRVEVKYAPVGIGGPVDR